MPEPNGIPYKDLILTMSDERVQEEAMTTCIALLRWLQAYDPAMGEADEPTRSLGPEQVIRLHSLVRALYVRARGVGEDPTHLQRAVDAMLQGKTALTP